MEKIHITNFNQAIRLKINNYIENNLMKCIDTNQSLNEMVDYLYSMQGEDKKTNYYEYFVGVAYLDAYKMFSYKQKNLLSSEEDIEFFYKLYNILDFNDLLAEVSANPGYLKSILKASYDYYNLPFLGRYLILKSLSPSENKKLGLIFAPHTLDLTEYNDPLTLDDIIKDIKRQCHKYQNVLSIDFLEGVIFSVCGYIKRMFNINKENAISICSELAKKDYLASIYLTRQIKDNDTLNNHIKLYENSSYEEIIAHFNNDDEFLFDTIWMLIDLYITKTFNDVSIDEKSIENGGNDTVIKKLIPKKDKKDK